jgi:hypothetical protein
MLRIQTNLEDSYMVTDWVKVAIGLEQYKWIMNNLRVVNVSNDRNFQKRFNHFYRMRQRTPQFYETFYTKLQTSKDDSNLTFEQVLDYFWETLSRVEASFSSKLVATVNPDMPVWDKEVLKNLGLKPPLYSDKNRLNKIKKLYNSINEWYKNYLNTEKSKEAISEFDKNFPSSGVSNIKKIDLILWQTRD